MCNIIEIILSINAKYYNLILFILVNYIIRPSGMANVTRIFERGNFGCELCVGFHSVFDEGKGSIKGGACTGIIT